MCVNIAKNEAQRSFLDIYAHRITSLLSTSSIMMLLLEGGLINSTKTKKDFFVLRQGGKLAL